MNNLIVCPKGGLGNRLRVIFSFWCFCQSKIHSQTKDLKLQIVWEKDKYCNGLFLDFFKEIPDVIFKNSNECLITTSRRLKIISDELYVNSLRYLQINDEMQLIVDNYVNLLGEFDAVHLRRTDHVKLAKKNKKFVKLEKFEEFISKSKNVFLATDCPKTQNYLMKKYQQINVFNKINNNKKLRKTSLEDSIFDMFICIQAKEFMGTPFSSFSDLIKYKRFLDK